jgi:hypothetical protein
VCDTKILASKYGFGLYSHMAILPNIIISYAGTAFAYGQTSSGKTYTMNGLENDPGIIQQAVKDIFNKIQKVPILEYNYCSGCHFHLVLCFADVTYVRFALSHFQTADREYLIRVSYMEIYNEDINDLLAVENQKLQIHESLEVSDKMVSFILSQAFWMYNYNYIYFFPAWSIRCRT